ncbi:MAG: DUF4105 domain-containing protein [Elusimicrobiales bacterium]|nr:DUF4105 domain-containing protein [Elusimicrobiales bacterium]
MRIKQVFAWFSFMALSCWVVMAISYSNFPYGARIAAAAVFGILALCSVFIPRAGRTKIIRFSSLFLISMAFWLALPPSNERDWAPDVAKLAYAEVAGSTVTLHNIRDCDYRSETDYTVRHYDRTFDLGSLRSLDLYFVDWGLPHIAHTMLSFGFGGGKYVCFSIETRKKKGEEYSSVRGFFKQYELIYVVADERDVVRLRANYRKGENVYLYRLDATPDFIRKVFLDYLQSVNSLKDRPQWYNALTANCTTDIWKHIAPYYPKAKFDWRILASGHVDEMAYELGVLDQSLPFPELKRRSLINERSKAAGADQAYSETIRRGLPGFK